MSKKDSTKEMKRLVVFDAHAVLHRAYHALPDFTSSKGEPTGALYGLSMMLISIIKEFKPDYLAAAFDLAGPTYRHEVYTDYKAGRKKTDNDLVKQMDRAREIFKAFNIKIYEKEGFEADDCLGGIVEQLRDTDIEIIIASGDMDTMQLVDKDKVKVYTLKKGIKDTVIYDEKSVIERFGFKPELLPDYKGLRGDASDNIIGVPGIGEKTATTLIQKFGTIEEIYKKLKKKPELFKEIGVTDRIQKILLENEEEAMFSKMLATIRRDVPIKFEIPEKNWSEEVRVEKIKNLFRDLEFRSLIGRLDEIFGTKTDVFQDEKIEIEKPNQEELEETLVALWLLNSSMTNPDLEDLYSFTKTESFKEAREKVFSEIKKQNLDFVFENIEKPLIQLLKEMKSNGIKVDRLFLQNLSEEYHQELSKIEKEIWKMSGEEFNINSPQQLANILFNQLGLKYKGMRKTSTGQFSTKEEVLEKLKSESEEGKEIVEKILEYRELQKLLSTYIDSIPEQIGEDGRLHSDFSQTGSTTGRMSSNNPNLQNIPIGSERGRRIRKAFITDKGKKFLALDYSQIELRIAAFLSGEEKLIEAFKNNEDIHTVVASQVFGLSKDEVDKESRRQAKVINFGILYGMGVTALTKNLHSDRKTAQEFYNKYFETYTKLASYLDEVKKEAAKNGYTTTLYGRRRHFEGLNSSLPFIRAQAERMAINAPIQGTGADIIKLAMVKVNEYLTKNNLKEEVKISLQIHDEIIYEVSDKIVEKISEEIKNIMEQVVSEKETVGVPIVVEYEIGENWGEMK